MSSKLKEKYGISFNLHDLIDDDFVVAYELSLFTFSIRRKICNILNGFLSLF
jgi:hypothetical protein